MDSNFTYKLKYLYSILIHSDVYSAIFKGISEVKSRVWDSKYIYNILNEFNCDSEINRKRTECREIILSSLKTHWNDHSIFSITCPTGLGKTLTGLSVMLELSNHTNINKHVYCLPFTSIIDQTESILDNILKRNDIECASSTILTHHHLT